MFVTESEPVAPSLMKSSDVLQESIRCLSMCILEHSVCVVKLPDDWHRGRLALSSYGVVCDFAGEHIALSFDTCHMTSMMGAVHNATEWAHR